MIPEAAENRKEFADCETGAEFTVEKYKNTSLSPRERAEDLPGRMSLEEKMGQVYSASGKTASVRKSHL
jgi:hypothetical protein